MQVIYKANDGTIFNNELDCQDYENDRKLLSYNKVVMLDLHLREVNLYSKAFFIVVPDDKEVLEYTEISEPGKYFFDCEIDSWIKLDEKKEELTELMQRIDDADTLLDKILEARKSM